MPPADRQSCALEPAFTNMSAVGVCSLHIYFRGLEGAPASSVTRLTRGGCLGSLLPPCLPALRQAQNQVTLLSIGCPYTVSSDHDSKTHLFSYSLLSCPEKEQGRFQSCSCRGAKAQDHTACWLWRWGRHPAPPHVSLPTSGNLPSFCGTRSHIKYNSGPLGCLENGG